MSEATQSGDEFQAAAERLLECVHRETQLPMIVCDATGTIVKAVDRSRIGTRHAGAQRILAGEVDEAAVSAEEAAQNRLVKEGYSCPIVVGGRRVGAFGITGPLALTRPLARTAAMVLASWMQEQERRSAVQRTSSEVEVTVKDLLGRLLRSASAAEQEVAALAGAARRAAERIGETDQLVQTMHEVARKSRMLSLNGSIEATRAGEFGAAFNVVALEIRALASDAGVAATSMQSALTEIGAAIKEASGAAARSAAAASQQATTMREVEQAFEVVRSSIERLGQERYERRPGAVPGALDRPPVVVG